MNPILNLAALFLLLFVLPGAIVLAALGKKFKNKAMSAWGWLLISLSSATILLIIGISGLGILFVILLPAFAVLVVIITITWLVFSIRLIVNGFKEHKGNSIALGFIFIGIIFTIVIVPVILIFIFGLPIRLM